MQTDPPQDSSKGGHERSARGEACGQNESDRALARARRPWGLKAFLLGSVPFLSTLMFASLIGLVTSFLTFYMLYPSGGLFVLSVETTRLDYEASGQNRGEIWLEGVLIRAGGKQVVDAAAHPALGPKPSDAVPTVETAADYFCYTGAITPGPASRVELTILDGAQFMKITPPADEPKDGDAGPKPTTLRLNGQKLVRTNDHKTRPALPEIEPINALLLVPQPDSDEDTAASEDKSGLDVGDFELPGTIDISADPECAKVVHRSQGFGTGGAVITIDGSAALGRKLRPVDSGGYVVDDDIPYLRGTVEVMISQVLCGERLFDFLSAGKQRDGAGCDRIYRIEAEPMTLPPGAAVVSEIEAEPQQWRFAKKPENPPAPFFGQVTYQDRRYFVNASTEADNFIILRPGQGGTLDDSNVLSVPFIDRVLLEPTLIIFVSLFFALSGLVLGILQVEDKE